MFDSSLVERWDGAVDALCAAPLPLADGGELRDLLRHLQKGLDRIEGLKAQALAQLDETGAYAEDGASSALSWARRELRLDSKASRLLRSAGRAMHLLPEVGSAVRSGEITLAHAREFTRGITKVGLDHMRRATDDSLLTLARAAEPAEVAAAVTHLDNLVHPERVEDSWRGGMDKHDIQVDRCGDGFHVSGFMDIANGAKLKTWLDAASAPRDADDSRTAAQRRLDAFGGLVDATLAHGMPTDRGVRPQVHVMVEAGWLVGEAGAEPPRLAGFGVIGRELFDYLACDAAVTPILVDGMTAGPTPQADVLNVGRAHRLATPRQRTAVLARQEGECAAPACRNTFLQIHHVAWWGRDHGRTDLDELVGLCPRCHAAIHAGRLHVAKDGARGFVFSRGAVADGATKRRLEDHHRAQRRRLRVYLRELRTIRDTTLAPPVRSEPTARAPAMTTLPTVTGGADVCPELLRTHALDPRA